MALLLDEVGIDVELIHGLSGSQTSANFLRMMIKNACSRKLSIDPGKEQPKFRLNLGRLSSEVQIGSSSSSKMMFTSTGDS